MLAFYTDIATIAGVGYHHPAVTLASVQDGQVNYTGCPMAADARQTIENDI